MISGGAHTVAPPNDEGSLMPEVLCVGLTTLDVTYYGADLPRPGVKVRAESATLAVGGPAANGIGCRCPRC